MPRLKLASLPFVVFEKIYVDLDFIDVINLASCSRRIENLVFSMTKLAKNGNELEVEVTKSQRRITVRGGNKKEFTWNSILERDWRAADVKVFKDRKLDEVVWTVSPCDSGFIVIGINDSDTIFWAQYLKDLFGCQLTNLTVDLDGKVDFRKLFMETNVLHVAENMEVKSPGVTPAEMTFMLDNFKVNDLTMKAETAKSYQYPKILNGARIPNILMSCAYWVNMEYVWNMAQTMRRIKLDKCKFSRWDLNRFLHSWLESSNRTMKYITITEGDDKLIDPQATSIFEGIKTRPMREFLGNSYRWIPDQDKASIRRGDGVEASVVVEQKVMVPCNEEVFHFYVFY